MSEPVTNEQLFELENFRGPLDLLLHLVREQELEITEVNLSHLCDQYLAALDVLRELDINVAGEFLVMASTLVLIKSRAILPREEVDLAEELDPGDELIMQLLEYRKFKTLSLELGRRGSERHQRHERGMHEVPPPPDRELEEIGLWDLVGSFARLVEELGLKRRFDTLRSEKPLKEYLRAVLDNLLAKQEWTFPELLVASGGNDEIFGVFLSVLELVKSRQIEAKQKRHDKQIVIQLREDRDESRLASLFAAPEPHQISTDEAPEARVDPAPEAVSPEGASEAPDPLAD